MEIWIFLLIEAPFELHTLRYGTRNSWRVAEKDYLAACKLFQNKVYYHQYLKFKLTWRII